MSRARRRDSIIAWKRDKHHGAIRGDADAVFDALKAANATCVYRWSPVEQAYTVPFSRYGAVLDALRARGHHVEWHGRPPAELVCLQVKPNQPEQLTLEGT